MKKNKLSYWEKRNLDLTEEIFDSSDEYVKRLAEIYDNAMAGFSREISYHLNKIAENNEITLSEAKKLLTDEEVKFFKSTLNDFRKKAKGKITPELEKELDLISRRVRISRLQAMETSLKTTVSDLMNEEERILFDSLSEVYKNTYYREVFDIQTITGYKTFSAIDEKTILKILKEPWSADKVNFSKRIWGRGDKLNIVLSTELSQALVRGENPSEIIKNLVDEFNVSKSNATRLVRTETAAFHSLARKDGYDDNNMEYFQVLATLDTRTSQVCRDMDTNVFKMKDFKVGITAPPFHPNCRTTHIPYFNDEIQERLDNELGRMARNLKTGKSERVENLKYEDWYKRYVL